MSQTGAIFAEKASTRTELVVHCADINSGFMGKYFFIFCCWLSASVQAQTDTIRWNDYIKVIELHTIADSVWYQTSDTILGEEKKIEFTKRKNNPVRALIGKKVGDTLILSVPVNYYFTKMRHDDRPNAVPSKSKTEITYIIKDIITPEEKEVEMQTMTNNESRIIALKIDTMCQKYNIHDSLAPGLYYKLIHRDSTAKAIKRNLTVHINYTGEIYSGAVFDANDNFKIVYGQTGLIPAWNIALNKAQLGDEFLLVCHPQLGYGVQPIPGTILGANEPLYFKIKVLEVY